ncbi:hypothetical protein K9L05_02085 [Candidatus Babeliales bacterium]|nr:hypothetical protein [Candidatus Babeliales bacterium]MCF7899418.1 hypothetical protein [Candidatus Babeliales bacterium]
MYSPKSYFLKIKVLLIFVLNLFFISNIFSYFVSLDGLVNQSQNKTVFLFGDFHDFNTNISRETTNLNFLKEFIPQQIDQNPNYYFYMFFEGPSEIKADFFCELTENNNFRLLNKIPDLITEFNKNSELIKFENINFRKISFLTISLFLADAEPRIYSYNPRFVRNNQADNLCEFKFKNLFDEFRENFDIIHDKISFLNSLYLENIFAGINSNFQDLTVYLNSQNITDQDFLLKIAGNMYLDNIEKFVTENICDHEVLLEIQERIRVLKMDFSDFITNYLSKTSCDWSSLKYKIKSLSNYYFGMVNFLTEQDEQDFITLLTSFNSNRNTIERKIAACFNSLIDLNILQNILNTKNNSKIIVVAGASHTQAVKEFLLNLDYKNLDPE